MMKVGIPPARNFRFAKNQIYTFEQLRVMKKLFGNFALLIGFAVVLVLSSCDKNKNLNLMSIEDDRKLGEQVVKEIESNTKDYPILDESKHPEAYRYMRNMFNTVLNSGKVQYRKDFNWSIKIIDDPNTLNAFAVPGGAIYVYTGLIKYLDKEDDLAGVIGHEIAHIDMRHTSRQITRAYGMQMVLSIILGQNASQLANLAAAIAGNAAGLTFSREFEREADAKSVVYLAETNYQCNGAYSFFAKLIEEEKAGKSPKFLSTHPAPQDRVDHINKLAKEMGCKLTPLNPVTYAGFKNSLP